MKAEWAPLSQGTAAPKALSEEGAPLFRRGSVTQVRTPDRSANRTRSGGRKVKSTMAAPRAMVNRKNQSDFSSTPGREKRPGRRNPNAISTT